MRGEALKQLTRKSIIDEVKNRACAAAAGAASDGLEMSFVQKDSQKPQVCDL